MCPIVMKILHVNTSFREGKASYKITWKEQTILLWTHKLLHKSEFVDCAVYLFFNIVQTKHTACTDFFHELNAFLWTYERHNII